ncbi:MAG TPA: PfkB family carbohydrate kinase [Dehalococcoidia bacterium]|nr:PfkB family carbohydrate kinase [Dehalococcoidia bacterium]
MSILVVGSAAFDDIETPFGRAQRVLGGSSIYFSAAASLFSPVRLVAVVGEDMPADAYDFLAARGVDLRGLQREAGKTFFWAGRYDYDLNTTETITTELNVFADFQPRLPEEYAVTPFVFLANIHPGLQRTVLDQVKGPRLTMMDSMNLWIQTERDAVEEMMRRVDFVSINETEARMFAGTSSVVAAARQILSLGPRGVLVKKGEYGVVLFTEDDYFAAPAYPLQEVYDPTGAGDSFAGGFIGYLAQAEAVTPLALKQAVIYGSAVASFTVQAFGVERLKTLTRREVEERCREFRRFTYFGEI